MQQSNIYKYSVVVFLLINSILLLVILFKKPKHPQRNRLNAKEILNLDNEQSEVFHEMAREHKKMMSQIASEQKSILNKYFLPLTKEETTSNKDSLVALIQHLEKQKIESTYQHLESVKDILRAEQLVKYDSFAKHALHRILSSPKKPPRPPKEFH